MSHLKCTPYGQGGSALKGAQYRKTFNITRVEGSCIPSKSKFKTQINNELRWLASAINLKLLHTGCPIANG